MSDFSEGKNRGFGILESRKKGILVKQAQPYAKSTVMPANFVRNFTDYGTN
jgi:hypothetical protein